MKKSSNRLRTPEKRVVLLVLVGCSGAASQPTPAAVQPTVTPAATTSLIAGTLFSLSPDGRSIQRMHSDGSGAQTVLAAERAIAAWQIDPTGHTLVYTLVYDRDIDGAQRAPTYTVNATGTVQQLPFDPFYRSAANITPLPFDGVADWLPDGQSLLVVPTIQSDDLEPAIELNSLYRYDLRTDELTVLGNMHDAAGVPSDTGIGVRSLTLLDDGQHAIIDAVLYPPSSGSRIILSAGGFLRRDGRWFAASEPTTSAHQLRSAVVESTNRAFERDDVDSSSDRHQQMRQRARIIEHDLSDLVSRLRERE
jgi:hypothetical protein